jgi:hypothetical protein
MNVVTMEGNRKQSCCQKMILTLKGLINKVMMHVSTGQSRVQGKNLP